MHSKTENGHTILVVDDYDDVRASLRYWLEGRGYAVLEAMDGQAAIEVASQHRPDLILMDIGLPKRSGISAVYKIRKDPSLHEVHIIAVTGYDTADLHEDALKAGCISYLIKPIDMAELQKLLRKLFNLQEQQ